MICSHLESKIIYGIIHTLICTIRKFWILNTGILMCDYFVLNDYEKQCKETCKS